MRAAPPFSDILFDCDSTLSAVEGIDELAGDREDIRELTRAVMEGRMDFAQVYARRLAKLKPSRASVEDVGRRYCQWLVEDARATVSALQAMGKRVHVLSGGLRPAIEALGKKLRVPPERLHAVEIRFDPEGEYRGYDEDSPLARNGGKAEFIRDLKDSGTIGRALFIGDGVTDLEAAGEVELFVGYGGVVEREPVREQSAVYIGCKSLAPILALALTPDEKLRLRGRVDFKRLLEKAEALLASDMVIQR